MELRVLGEPMKESELLVFRRKGPVKAGGAGGFLTREGVAISR